MLGVLLESRAPRQRRAGGAAMSVAAHLAIIGAVAATAAHATHATSDRPPLVVLRFVPPPPPPIAARMMPGPAAPSIVGPAPDVNLMRLLPLTHIPATIPPVVQVSTRALDDIAIGGAPRGSHGVPTGILGDGNGDGTPGGNTWIGNEALMHLLATVKPRYPESLRSAGIDGRVLVQFTVDTLGRVEMPTVKVLSSTHDLFARSVIDALRGFRFAPAEVAGHRVPALAEMPFEFQIAR